MDCTHGLSHKKQYFTYHVIITEGKYFSLEQKLEAGTTLRNLKKRKSRRKMYISFKDITQDEYIEYWISKMKKTY